MGSDCEQTAWRCSAYDWLRVPWAGLGEKKGRSCPAHSLQIGSIPGGSAVGRGPGRARSIARLPRGGGEEGPLCFLRHHPLFVSSTASRVSALLSPARPIRTVQLGQTPILSKATKEKNLDLQGMWVTVCCTLALFTLQNNSPTLCDIPPDPRGRLGAEV